MTRVRDEDYCEGLRLFSLDIIDWDPTGPKEGSEPFNWTVDGMATCAGLAVKENGNPVHQVAFHRFKEAMTRIVHGGLMNDMMARSDRELQSRVRLEYWRYAGHTLCWVMELSDDDNVEKFNHVIDLQDKYVVGEDHISKDDVKYISDRVDLFVSEFLPVYDNLDKEAQSEIKIGFDELSRGAVKFPY